MSYYCRYTKEQFLDILARVDPSKMNLNWEIASKEDRKKALRLPYALMAVVIFLGVFLLIGTFFAIRDVTLEEFFEDGLWVAFLLLEGTGVIMIRWLYIFSKKEIENIKEKTVWKKEVFIIRYLRENSYLLVDYGIWNVDGEINLGFASRRNMLNNMRFSATPGTVMILLKTEDNKCFLDWDKSGKNCLAKPSPNGNHWVMVRQRKFIRGKDHRLLEIYCGNNETEMILLSQIQRLDCADECPVNPGRKFFVEKYPGKGDRDGEFRENKLEKFEKRMTDIVEKDMDEFAANE